MDENRLDVGEISGFIIIVFVYPLLSADIGYLMNPEKLIFRDLFIKTSISAQCTPN